jgi:hypothetical protein
MGQLEQLAKRVLETGGSEVERALREELRRVSEPEKLRKLAEGFYAEPEVSVPTFERVLELTPEDLVVRVELGFVYFLRRILQKDPLHEVARSKLHELGALPSGNGTPP